MRTDRNRNIKRIFRTGTSVIMAAALAFAPAAGISSRADVIISPKVVIGVGPGGSMQGVDTSSPDWADYKETGGAAQGAMNISTFIPSGCINSCALDTPNPIVQNADKYSYDYMVNDLWNLQQRYGRNMTYHSLATTADGRNIYEVVIEDVIEPRNTRFRVIRALETLDGKRQDIPAKKHDNLPL